MTLRELKYVILGDDQLSAKMKKISGASDNATRALGNHSDKLNTLKNKVNEAGNAVPVFGTAMSNMGSVVAAVANPITIAAVVVGSLSLAMAKGVKEASAFELEFRKLQNINLDKTKAEIDGLRERVLNMSLTGGFDPTKTSRGIFDIQSLTGNTGFGSDYIVRKQYKFARAAGADPNEYIAGAGTAMKNYGFGAEKLDEYNKSAMGAIATSRLTYEELARVSAIYAGAASSANQSFNSANKLMSLFKAKTNSAEEAATLTKTAFTDLFKKANIDSFKAIGMVLYDLKGNARQADQIMLELNGKFGDKKSAKAMDELRNKFQGSEGINALLSVAKDQSGALLNTLNTFDKAGGGLEKMLNTAKKDINEINDRINNQLKTSWVMLGEAVLPIWVKIKNAVSNAIGPLAIMMKNGGSFWGSFAEWQRMKGFNEQLDAYYEKELKNASKGKELRPQGFLDLQRGYQQKYMEAFNIVNKGIGDAETQRQAHQTMSANQDLSQLLQNSYYGAIGIGKPGARNPDKDLENKLNSVSGGGVRNVTVTIKSLIENFTIETNNIHAANSVIKSQVEKVMVEAVAGSEQILGSN